MTTRIYFASNSLGLVSEPDLQRALDHFNLGELVHFHRTAEGVMGQTLLVQTTEGEFMLKGNPLYNGQFQEEQFFAEQLAARTTIPVPVPYRIQEDTQLLGWSYVMMPKLPGNHLYDPVFQTTLTSQDHEDIADVLAETLAELHHWKVPDAGEYDPVADKIMPFAGSYLDWLYGSIRHWLHDAEKYSVITDDDVRWVDEQLKQSEAAFLVSTIHEFVMGDFKVENFLIQKADPPVSSWRISGLFDFTTAYFGDGTADLTKMTARYLREDRPDLAARFLHHYRENVCADDVEKCKHFRSRLLIHLLYQRILCWGEAKATGQVTWEADLPFAPWAEQYIEKVLSLLD